MLFAVPRHMKKPDAFSCCMMTLVGAMWGLHGPVIKFAFAAGFTFPQLVLGESLVAALVFGSVVVVRGTRPPTSRRDWVTLLTAGAFTGGVPLFLFWAYRLGPVPIGATLFFLYVPFTQVINVAVTCRLPAAREIASAALVVVGAVLATDFFDQANAANLHGVPFAVLAAFCFAVSFVLNARLGHAATPAFRSCVCSTVATVEVLALAIVVGWPLLPAGIAPVRVVVWLTSLGVIWQAIPVFLLMSFIGRTGSGLGSILTSSELPVAVISAALILGDHISPSQSVGIVLVLAGIALPQLPRRPLFPDGSATEPIAASTPPLVPPGTT
jgi:drug/metabolite transporter (DMT)-like permease